MEKNCNMVCPMCEEKRMTCIKYKETYIYVCEPCPFIGFEFVTQEDKENMIEWLKTK